jgi:aerobic-type carbon monoxide dehydrogenase small subunit (CoxS/CutS family)
MKDDREPGPPPHGLSRRELLRRGLAGVVTTGILAPGLLAKDETRPTGAKPPVPDPRGLVGPGAATVTLRVNGKDRTLDVEPRVTLLDALRDRLDLTGAKKVCDRGQCGACTVLLDGKPVYSCSVLAIEAQGTAITTVEGLGSPEKLHPIQAAFVEADAQQCGFCTPGFVMACHALLAGKATPAPDDLEHGLGGNLCRCGTYSGIKAALASLASQPKGASLG